MRSVTTLFPRINMFILISIRSSSTHISNIGTAFDSDTSAGTIEHSDSKPLAPFNSLEIDFA